MIDSMFQGGTDQALDDQQRRPRPYSPTLPNFSVTDILKAPFQGIGSAGANALAFGSEITGAFGDVAGAAGAASAGGMFAAQSDAERKDAEEARRRMLDSRTPMSNEAGDLFRARAKDIMPDPQSTHVSAQVVAGFSQFAAQALGYGMALGPAGPLALGGDVAFAESDRLKGEGVDLATRAKAGAVAGIVGAGSVVVPMSGATAAVRAVKGVAVGEGSLIGQSAAERAILRSAGYDKIADTFDPFDPVALGVGLVPGVLGAKFGHAAVKSRDLPAGAKPLAEMGLPERQALKFDDVRLDAYAVGAAQRAGVPPEVLLAVKNAGEKSGPTATSPAGAQGVMQFMPATWKEFGRGDPMDPMNSIDAGAAYLKKLHDAYGSWDAAVAHYNGGGAQAALVRGGGRPSIPETAAYLDRYRKYVGQTFDEHAAAAVRAQPDLVPAARVAQAAAAIEGSRLTGDADLAGRDAHLSAVEMAGDQIGRGDAVHVDDLARAGLEYDPSPAPDGMVRYYHGGNPEGVTGPLWFTSDLRDAHGWAARDSSMGIHFVDVAADHPARGGEPEFGVLPPSRMELPAELASQRQPLQQRPIQGERMQRTADAAEQLRIARAPQELPAQRTKQFGVETSPHETRQGKPPAPPAARGSDATGKTDMAPAHIARAAAEASMLRPDLLVHMDGMDAPARVGDLLARIKEEAAMDATDARLLEVAAACALRH